MYPTRTEIQAESLESMTPRNLSAFPSLGVNVRVPSSADIASLAQIVPSLGVKQMLRSRNHVGGTDSRLLCLFQGAVSRVGCIIHGTLQIMALIYILTPPPSFSPRATRKSRQLASLGILRPECLAYRLGGLLTRKVKVVSDKLRTPGDHRLGLSIKAWHERATCAEQPNKISTTTHIPETLHTGRNVLKFALSTPSSVSSYILFGSVLSSVIDPLLDIFNRIEDYTYVNAIENVEERVNDAAQHRTERDIAENGAQRAQGELERTLRPVWGVSGMYWYALSVKRNAEGTGKDRKVSKARPQQMKVRKQREERQSFDQVARSCHAFIERPKR
ncbi:hypothetical protein B0H19DRAFT_1057192 [Mycena capillaripes]|nr:hypothetical protein B0H19DRAFT_1057192 [Mycena capillaripes]